MNKNARRQRQNSEMLLRLQILDAEIGSNNIWKTIAKNIWYPFSSRTKWLTFPCYSHLSIMKNPGDNSTDKHRMPLKGGKKRPGCLRILRLQTESTVSSLSVLFIIHISYTMGATNARDSPFSPDLEQGWLNLYSTPAKSAAILGQQWI